MKFENGFPILDDQEKMVFMISLGVIGGIGVGWGAVQHMFIRGMEDKERKTLMYFGAGLAGIYGIAKLFDIDEKYWNVDKAGEAVQKALVP